MLRGLGWHRSTLALQCWPAALSCVTNQVIFGGGSAAAESLGSRALAPRSYSNSVAASPRGWGIDQGHHPHEKSTVYALSTAPGRAAVAVIRATGANARAVLRLLPGRSELPPERTATLVTFADPLSGDTLDRGLLLWFPAPRSFTGEDCCELHLHGGPAVVAGVLSALGRLGGWRLAEPGEFSRRAFHSGKLDLTSLEGLADLLAADTVEQRRQALLLAGGALRRKYDAWRAEIIRCLAHVEAVIDFGEDEGLSSEVAAAVVPRADALRRDLSAHVSAGESRGELVRGGVRVVLYGPPNAGKSSLLNALAGRDVAIVSPTAGTTRDAIDVALDLGGIKVNLTDTAGLRESAEAVEGEGITRAVARVRAAHVRVLVLDLADLHERPRDGASEQGAARGAPAAWAQALREHGGSSDADLLVLNKSDAVAERAGAGGGETFSGRREASSGGAASDAAAAAAQPRQAELVERALSALRCSTSGGARGLSATTAHVVSCRTGEGIDALCDELRRAAGAVLDAGTGPAGEGGEAVTRLRHRQHLAEAVALLDRFVRAGAAAAAAGPGPVDPERPLSHGAASIGVSNRRAGGVAGDPDAEPFELELAAEDLRAAAAALGRVTGKVGTEAVLDSLFAEFCIGK